MRPREFTTYRAASRKTTCGKRRTDCKTTVKPGGAMVWRVPDAYVGGIGLGIPLDVVYPQMLPTRTNASLLSGDGKASSVRVYITIFDNIIATDLWTVAPTTGYWQLKKAEILPERMAGLLHYRDPKPQHAGVCTRRDYILANPEMTALYAELLQKSDDKYVCWPTGDEYFVSPPGEDMPKVFMKCPPTAIDGGVGFCTSTAEFRGWMIEYMFPGRKRREWASFHTAVLGLLATFAYRECDAPTKDDMRRAPHVYALRNCKELKVGAI
jgi:hypothetical protein